MGPNHDTVHDVAVTVPARLRKWLTGLHLNQLWQRAHNHRGLSR